MRTASTPMSTMPQYGGVESSLDQSVRALLVEVGQRVIMPRFQNLQDHEVSEKSRGEVVTVVDREAERWLQRGLEHLDPGSRAIGEEAVAHDPRLLDHLTKGRVWVIDPLDGTSNFAGARRPFGIIIALLVDGETEAGWLYDPVSGRCCHTWRGEGAYIDGERWHATASDKARPIAALASQFMPEAARTALHESAERVFDLVPIPRAAVEHYPRIMLGENDLAVFQRTLPWDHAAGILLLTEAGGHASRWDGSPYRIGDGGVGLIVAADRAIWAQAMNAFGPMLCGVGNTGLSASGLGGI